MAEPGQADKETRLAGTMGQGNFEEIAGAVVAKAQSVIEPTRGIAGQGDNEHILARIEIRDDAGGFRWNQYARHAWRAEQVTPDGLDRSPGIRKGRLTFCTAVTRSDTGDSRGRFGGAARVCRTPARVVAITFHAALQRRIRENGDFCRVFSRRGRAQTVALDLSI